MDNDATKTLWYPAPVVKHEMERGIIRSEFIGGLYVHCPNFAYTNAQLDREKARREHEYRLWEYSGSPLPFSEWKRDQDERTAGGGGNAGT